MHHAGITVIWSKKSEDPVGLCRKCSLQSMLSSASLCMMNRITYIGAARSKLFLFLLKVKHFLSHIPSLWRAAERNLWRILVSSHPWIESWTFSGSCFPEKAKLLAFTKMWWPNSYFKVHPKTSIPSSSFRLCKLNCIIKLSAVKSKKKRWTS